MADAVSGCVISVHNIIPTFYSWFVLLAIISACFDLILGGGKLKLEGGNPSAPPPLYATLHMYMYMYMSILAYVPEFWSS